VQRHIGNMCFLLSAILLIITMAVSTRSQDNSTSGSLQNVLTKQEIAEGWRLLFDGKTFNGWRGAYLDSLPSRGWEVRDGMLIVQASGGGEAAFGGDIVTREEYGNFDLRLD
jgi:hypothetical protein